jgi:hypothetical protein
MSKSALTAEETARYRKGWPLPLCTTRALTHRLRAKWPLESVNLSLSLPLIVLVGCSNLSASYWMDSAADYLIHRESSSFVEGPRSRRYVHAFGITVQHLEWSRPVIDSIVRPCLTEAANLVERQALGTLVSFSANGICCSR